VASVAERLKLVGLEAAEAVLEVRIKSLQTELIAKQVERELLTRNAGSREGEVAIMSERMSELRGSDETVSKEGDSS
jgi:circadian clock protein KaiC